MAGGQGASAADKKDAEDQGAANTRGPSDAERELYDFNSSIHSVCANIDSLISDILKSHPDLASLDTHVIE